MTGSDSAPAKANEAEQKNDIGTAKDEISLLVVNAKTEGYETAYVGNGVSAGDASKTVGQAVIDAVKAKDGKSVGKASISVEQTTKNEKPDDAKITITTRDFEVEGTITINDGILTWGEIVPNVPGVFLDKTSETLNPGGSVELTARLKNASEPITWSGDTSNIRLSSSTGKTVIVSVEPGTSNGENTTITATSSDGYSDTCTIRVEIVPVEVVQFTAKPAENKMNKNQTTTLQIATTDNNGKPATPTSVTYLSTEESVATVERITGTTNATLTAVGAGSTTIRVTVSNGTNSAVTAEFNLTVIAAPTPAEEDTSYVGYYAEIDGDIVGIIYADLLAQETRSGSGRLRRLEFGYNS